MLLWTCGSILCALPELFPFLFGGEVKFLDHFFKEESLDQFIALYLHVALGVGSSFLKMNWQIISLLCTCMLHIFSTNELVDRHIVGSIVSKMVQMVCGSLLDHHPRTPPVHCLVFGSKMIRNTSPTTAPPLLAPQGCY